MWWLGQEMRMMKKSLGVGRIEEADERRWLAM